MLLLEEVHLVDVGELRLAEVVLEVRDGPAHLLQQLVQVLAHLVLQRRTLTPQDLRVALVVLQVLVQKRGVVLLINFISKFLTMSVPTRCIMGWFDALKFVPADVTRWVLAVNLLPLWNDSSMLNNVPL